VVVLQVMHVPSRFPSVADVRMRAIIHARERNGRDREDIGHMRIRTKTGHREADNHGQGEGDPECSREPGWGTLAREIKLTGIYNSFFAGRYAP